MMKKIIRYGLVWVITVSLFSCGKGGTDGPQGAEGKQGIPGPAGSAILSGSGVPAGSAGSNGDFYLDLTASRLYGPKSSAGWGGGLNLRGEEGTEGKPGNTIRSGNGEPASENGAAGDFYLDRDTYNFYGPKVGSEWGVPTALQGPQGPMTGNIMIDTFPVRANDWLPGGGYRATRGINTAYIQKTKYYDRASAVLTGDYALTILLRVVNTSNSVTALLFSTSP